MMRLRGLFAAIGLLVLASGHAGAGGQGLLNAVAYKPMPASAPINVRPLDNSDENLALKASFETELRGRGYTVASDAAIVLSFEVRNVVGAWRAGTRRSVLEFEGHGGGGGENAKALLNIFDSRRGGLLNEGGGGATSITTPSKYRIDATVDDRRSGQRLWQAWAIADLRLSDGPTLTRAMVPVLVRTLGTTVKRQSFPLR
jgi:hypothetical protein